MVKEDGSQAKLDEKLQFKVIEFNKDAKRIILSHSRIFEDAQKAANNVTEETATSEEKPKKTKKTTKKAEETTTSSSMEKTTLGDIEGLADLREEMDKEEKKAAKKKAAK